MQNWKQLVYVVHNCKGKYCSLLLWQIRELQEVCLGITDAEAQAALDKCGGKWVCSQCPECAMLGPVTLSFTQCVWEKASQGMAVPTQGLACWWQVACLTAASQVPWAALFCDCHLTVHQGVLSPCDLFILCLVCQ